MRGGTWIAGCMGALALCACALLRPPTALPAAPQATAAPHAGALRIAQAESGPRKSTARFAPFVLCSDDACPRVTPKTLAQAAPARQHDAGQGPRPAPPAPLASPQTPRDPSAQQAPASKGHEAGTAVPATPQASAASPGLPDEAEGAAGPQRRGDIAATVRFPFGDARLNEAARAQLDTAARQASEAGALHRLRIVGRTDSSGPQAVNDALAMARARAVRDHLRHRLPRWPATVDIEAAGACCYAASNDTAHGRLANRRVEITLSASDPEDAP